MMIFSFSKFRNCSVSSYSTLFLASYICIILFYCCWKTSCASLYNYYSIIIVSFKYHNFGIAN